MCCPPGLSGVPGRPGWPGGNTNSGSAPRDGCTSSPRPRLAQVGVGHAEDEDIGEGLDAGVEGCGLLDGGQAAAEDADVVVGGAVR